MYHKFHSDSIKNIILVNKRDYNLKDVTLETLKAHAVSGVDIDRTFGYKKNALF